MIRKEIPHLGYWEDEKRAAEEMKRRGINVAIIRIGHREYTVTDHGVTKWIDGGPESNNEGENKE